MKRDAVELTERYKGIEQQLIEKIEKRLKGVPKRRGYIHKYWKVQREILKEDYGIDWKSPGVLNRHIKFD